MDLTQVWIQNIKQYSKSEKIRVAVKLANSVLKGNAKAVSKILSQRHPKNVEEKLKHEVHESKLLVMAVQMGYIGVLNVLYAHGANLNGPNIPQVHVALICPIPVLMLKALHRLGADMNALCPKGFTALGQCVLENSIDEETQYSVIKTLLELGADSNLALRSTTTVTPIQILFSHRYAGNKSRLYNVTKLLVEAGANINVPIPMVRWGARTSINDANLSAHALYQAVNNGNTDAVTTLVEMGAAINRPMMNFYHGAFCLALTPVIVSAILKNHFQIVRALTRLGAHLNPCLIFTAHDVILSEIHTRRILAVNTNANLQFPSVNEADESTAFRYIHMKLCRAMTRKKRFCHSCGQGQSHSMKLKKCGRCRAAYYCSKACQEAAYRQGKHCC